MASETRTGFPAGPYLSLVTFRRDGREVATPVWYAEAGGRLYVYTLAEAGKLKRLRNDPHVKVAPCTLRGAVTGPWREGTARIVEHPGVVRAAYAGLRRKYGWQYRIGTLLSRLSGKFGRRRVIEIQLGSA